MLNLRQTFIAIAVGACVVAGPATAHDQPSGQALIDGNIDVANAPPMILQHATWAATNLEHTASLIKTLLPLKEVASLPSETVFNIRYLVSDDPRVHFQIHLVEYIPGLNDGFLEEREIVMGDTDLLKKYTNFINNHFAVRVYQKDIMINALDVLLNQKFPEDLLNAYPNNEVPHFGPMKLSDDIYQFYVETPDGQLMEIQLYQYDKLREENPDLPPYKTWRELTEEEKIFVSHHGPAGQ